MKVKGIMFFGIMGAILMSASANAANQSTIKIASQGYVDKAVDAIDANIELKADKADLDALETKEHANATFATQATVGDVKVLAETMGVENPQNATVADLILEAATSGPDLTTYATKEYADGVGETAVELANEYTDAKVGAAADLAETSRYNVAGTIVDALKKTDADLDTLELDVIGVMDDIDTVNAKVGDTTQLAESFTGDQRASTVAAINALAAKTADTSDLTALQERVTTAEGKITAAEGKITTVEGQITAAEGRLTTVEGVADTASTNAQQALTNIGTVSALETESKTDLVGAINELHTEMGKTATNAGLEELKATVAQNTADIETKAASADLNTHVTNETIHVTAAEKESWNAKIPKPGDNCNAASGRCVLSVTTTGDLMWLDVTAPLETTTDSDDSTVTE